MEDMVIMVVIMIIMIIMITVGMTMVGTIMAGMTMVGMEDGAGEVLGYTPTLTITAIIQTMTILLLPMFTRLMFILRQLTTEILSIHKRIMKTIRVVTAILPRANMDTLIQHILKVLNSLHNRRATMVPPLVNMILVKAVERISVQVLA